MPTPIEFLREAIRAVPAVKYALGVGGIVAAVAIVYSFKLDPRVAFVGTVVTLVLMGVLVIFARMAALAGPRLHLPAIVFTWFVLFLFMATCVSLFTSVFFQRPLDLRHWLQSPSAASQSPRDAASAPDAAARLAARAACVNARLTPLLRGEAFSAENGVRCEGGGAFGNGQSRNGTVAYQAPPGFHIVGNVELTELSATRGSKGAVNYIRDTDQRVVRVETPIGCSSPNQIGGPGAWMHARLSGRIEAIVSRDEQAAIQTACANAS